MSHKRISQTLPLLLLIVPLALSSCASYFQIERTAGSAPTPIVSVITGGVENPDVYVDPAEFQTALLQALNDRDSAKLQKWMSDPFFTGTWRGGLSETSPANAAKLIFAELIMPDGSLTVVEEVDLKALMGGLDPLSLLPSDSGLIDAFLIAGLGNDGRDEAVLLVARQVDNSLKLKGWMLVNGGFSGARLGGLHLYENEASGYSLYLPKGFEIFEQTANSTVITAPGEGPDRGHAFIAVEPAGGRTAEQVVQSAKAELGDGFNIRAAAIEIEDTQALAVTGLPGQDSNRQLFMVRGDLLYHMTFIPDDPELGRAYLQMEDIYAQVINTFHFMQ